jgi:hypothetical protein
MQPNSDPRKGWTSASNATADQLCPGRHLASKNIPEPPRSADADAGTRIHDAIAKGSAEGLSLEEAEMFDACREIESKKATELFGADLPKAKVWRHERYWVRYMVNGVELQHSGEADCVYRYGPKALVIDYKTGQGQVAESPSNQQLRDIATMAWGHFVTLDGLAVVIVQPLVTHQPEVCLYEQDAIERAAAEMIARVVASNDPKSPRVAGDVQCKWCKAKSRCVEYQKFSGGMVPTVVEPVVQEGLFTVAMANWSPEQRAIAASIIGPAGARLEEIKQFLKDGLAKDPAFIPGWALSPGAKKETIIDPQACFDRFSAIGGKLEDFMKTVSVGKSRLREAVNVVTGAKGRALDSAIKTLTEGLVEQKQNSPSLERVKP